MEDRFNKFTFPNAVRQLFLQNNYDVVGPTKIHGAEVDLIATPRSDPFGSQIYIEATVEHVGNTKYGKDSSKFVLIKQIDSSARCLIVSLKGFTLPVKERAEKSKIDTLTYDELFSKFERFDPYITNTTGEGEEGKFLRELSSVYEEHYFDDMLGYDKATEFLTRWRDDKNSDKKWLIVVGEYGTGKTALTKILQYRWSLDYHDNAALPIPFRIELRDFTRQFDAAGLIHHFLDHNSLGHIPINFVNSLIRSGKIILILDGYDEMAQYLHARERRVCLETLAELSFGGAKGILTSRPSYFSEAEELQILETLYASLEHFQFGVELEAKQIVEKEKKIDNLIQTYHLNRYERNLKDLTPDQTEALINRHLQDDLHGREVVLQILKKIFRSTGEGSSHSLSGKPVIISYLLEVVEQLKEGVVNGEEQYKEVNSLNEWQVYKLIVNKLMLRDYKRVQFVPPDKRRSFLQVLSLKLTERDTPVVSENEFKSLIRKEFKNELRMVMSENKEQIIENYFSDLRSSSTLSRTREQEKQGWKFSHNSLREFLLVEYMLHGLKNDKLVSQVVPVSDPMRLFVNSLDKKEINECFQLMSKMLARYGAIDGLSQLLNLFWDAFLNIFNSEDDPVRSMLMTLSGSLSSLDGMTLSGVSFSCHDKVTDLRGVELSNSVLSSVNMSNINCTGSNFLDSIFENVDMSDSDFSKSNFSGSLLYNVNISGANIRDAIFIGVDSDLKILVDESAGGGVVLEGRYAIGFLKYNKAITDDVPAYYELCNHPKFPIIHKISKRLNEQASRQKRGLTQRGSARNDPAYANLFLAYLEKNKFAMTDRSRPELINATQKGKEVFSRLLDNNDMSLEIESFLRQNPG